MMKVAVIDNGIIENEIPGGGRRGEFKISF